jgi:signal recognition particle subunit SRP54
MFNSLSERLQETLKKVRGHARITEENIKETLRDIRMSLLEADVALSVVRALTDEIQKRAIGQEVIGSLNPGQALVKIVHDELIHLMGDTNTELELKQSPAVILLAGLQGSGKTTTVAKLARFLKERQKLKVLVTSCDIYRPAAIEQLKMLSGAIDVDFFPSGSDEAPLLIAQNALTHAKKQFFDVLIIDTAGRLHIDEAMMAEIKQLHQLLSPSETLFVVDSMTGQDAANTAKAFHEALPLTGVILSKVDGDARGGAALSIRYITGKPIKFIGVGEKTDALDVFHPDRIVSRILGMGDVLSLVEEVERKVDKAQAEKLAKKLRRGKGFNLEDFRDQILQMNKMGGILGIMNKLPGMGALPKDFENQVNDETFIKVVAIINSMTRKERYFPKIIGGSRKNGLQKVQVYKFKMSIVF